ncbi:MAG: hypothetical protein KME23_02060 [Goleter apudmare HA4340-LM2]|jgi:hypothetical protein|nr:hypothetical protein [Goleter apudmare HA4340-LM2]
MTNYQGIAVHSSIDFAVFMLPRYTELIHDSLEVDYKVRSLLLWGSKLRIAPHGEERTSLAALFIWVDY